MRRLVKRFSWVHLLAVGVLAVMVAVRFADPAPVEKLRDNVFDIYQRIEPRGPSRQPVVIVDLDEESLAEYGQWPWPRTLIADLVSKLQQYGTAAIAFDAVFAEPDRTSPDNVARSLPELDADTRATLAALPSNDAALAEVLKRGPVVLGQSTAPREVQGEDKPPPSKAAWALKSVRGVDPKRFIFDFPALVRNLPELEAAASGLGVFTVNPALDGVLRQVPLVTRIGDQLYPTLTVELLRVLARQSTVVVKANKGGLESILVAGLEIPTDSHGQVWVKYAPHDPGLYISARDVLNGTVPAERLRGHVVLVGTSAVGLLDLKATPVDEAVPGVEVHAQLLQNILDQTFLRRPNWALGAEVVALVLAGLLMIVLVPFLGAAWTLMLGISTIAGLVGLSWWLFSSAGLLLDMIYVADGTFLVYAVLTYLNYVREERERRRVRGAFSRYMSPDLVAQLADDPSRLKLGGEMREMTLLFADIRGFTTISEQFDAEGLTRFINRYLTPMTNVVLEHRGTIDKYMGDCIMAFWNAPLDDPDHAEHGVRAALAMIAESKKMNQQLEAEAESEGRKAIALNIGIGLNTGVCCVGNMGSDLRFDYSVLGDDVNLASRLEGQSKNYGVDIVIGDQTHEQVSHFACVQLDRIQVKGKTVPVNIYGVLGDESMADTSTFGALKRCHEEMLNAYRAQDWRVTRRKLVECRSLDGLGVLRKLHKIYAERVELYEAMPPDTNWDGVFVATSK